MTRYAPASAVRTSSRKTSARVGAAFGSNHEGAVDHWTTLGLPKERRRGSREFDVAYYETVYGDLRAAFGANHQAAFDHWVTRGLPVEGRRGTRELDVRYYEAFYPDIGEAFGSNYLAAVDHWTTLGLPRLVRV